LPGIAGIIVQLCLFALVVLVLVVKKKWEDRGRSYSRPWLVFFLDCSKQLIGAGWVHLLNLACSEVLGEEQAETHTAMGSCEWYWISIVIDDTLGVLVEYYLLPAITAFAVLTFGDRNGDFRSGNYRDPETGLFQPVRYAKQLAVWLLVVTSMKVIMLVLMLLFRHPLQGIAKFVLRPVLRNPMAELIVVMIVTPFFMNALQCWVVDNFIKDNRTELRDWDQTRSAGSSLQGSYVPSHDVDNNVEHNGDNNNNGNRRQDAAAP